jgi:predicted GH43/DUF377 family glycosyl hydrolase
MAARKKKKKIIRKKKVKKFKKVKIASKRVHSRRAKKIKKRIKKVKKVKIASKRTRSRRGKAAKKKISVLDLKRSGRNPIIEPSRDRYWESKATFNPTAVYHDGKVHIIYRAVGDSDISVLGYAKSHDGHNIIPESKELAYYHRNKPTFKKFYKKKNDLPQIFYSSGGGWSGGCEDPRITLLDNELYMIYTSFDGWGSVRMAMTSITLEDFIKRRWNWKEPIMISPPEQIHKNWVLFPEKIKGKYAILHSVSPKIMIDYFDSLDELDGDNFIYSVHQGSPLWGARDKLVRGVGPAPIKTKYGWLVLYHKMEQHETHKYKLWAMILDAKDPTKVLHRSIKPILEPDEWYENEGYKGGVVYSCGAVVKDGELFVYYGGADKVSCVATASLDKFLNELVHKSAPAMKTKKTKK